MLVIIAVTETKFQFLLADKNLQNEGSILQIALFGESDIATLEFCLLLFFCTYYYMMRVEFALKIATLHCSTKICLMRDSMMTTHHRVSNPAYLLQRALPGGWVHCTDKQLMVDGQSTVTAVVFSQIWTCSLTQPLSTDVKVGGKVYSTLCTLSLGLPKNAFIPDKPCVGDGEDSIEKLFLLEDENMFYCI